MAFVGRHTVNVVAVCVVSGLNSLSFSSLQSLQSSLNDSKGLGLASLSCFYAALTVSCLLISPVMLQKLGTKKTLILGSVAYGLNAASNFYPKFFILIPSAILCGLGTGPSWAAISTMLNTLAVNKAGLRSSLAEVLTSRYMAFQNASWQISNTVATFVLSQVLTRHVSEEGLLDSSNFSSSCCGARDCGAEIPEETIGTLRPPEVLIRIFLGVFAASGLILAPLIGLFFMDNVKPCYHHVSANLSAEQKQSNWLATLHALREPHLLMLMPFAVFIGAYYSFVVGDFTKSFVSCTQGVHDVGYIIAVFAASDAIFTIIFGLLRQYVSRLVMLTVAATLIEGAFVFSVLWDPEERQRWHLFVLAVVWSVGDAVWQMQIRGTCHVCSCPQLVCAYVH
ncbi:protein unc-93 homolog A-like [Acanthaster planci]|uniref:Protein unc-93 homolog A-like n=1 Tax=Acanthaster planci TaxID=133434 RepID=A0A8B7Y0R5_ACAPL|nr:protein unc-93 homolog A-like [Acanthaster planci]